MLSLTPRFDLFKFQLPKDWFPDEIVEKYQSIINKNSSVIMDPVSYVNESIVGVTVPGLSDLVINQSQTSTNANPLGRMRYNREPVHDNSYKTLDNPLAHIDKEFTVTFRQNQGLYNYFMLYESIFWHVCKPQQFDRGEDVFKLYIADDKGEISSTIKLYQPLVSSIDGLEFTYSKVERSAETFNVKFSFNNIDFDFV